MDVVNISHLPLDERAILQCFSSIYSAEKLESLTISATKGIGMGLFIVHNALQALGGELTFKNVTSSSGRYV